MNTNVTENLKEKAAKLIELSKSRLGSYAAVANKCKISDGAITQVRTGKYAAEGTEMYRRIIAALELFEDNWNIVETTNLKKLMVVINDSRKKSLFMAVSEKAGSGKTVASRNYVSGDASNSTYYIRCRAWGNRTFLMYLLRSLGINPESRNSTNDDLLQLVIDFFKMRVDSKPVLLIDQANSLRGSAFTNIIIHLFNELEGQMGMVAFGTEALAKMIKKGVKYNKEGFDETDSRLGRRYITLPGSTMADVSKICKANGITDDDRIAAIFNECSPIKKSEGGRMVTVVEDHRRIKRIVLRELLKQQNN
jgi:hypothetical protein